MCVGLPGRRSFGPGLIFLVLFASRQKVQKEFATFFITLRQINMKKLALLFSIALLAITSCDQFRTGINIKHSEHGHYYEMTASFYPEKDDAVGKYLDRELHSGDLSFANSEVDADITLDDKTTFYMKKSSGYLKIKLDKEKNSEQAYRKVRSALEGINEVVK